MTFAGTVDDILEKKVLKVGTTGDYIPFTISENGNYSGYDIEVATLIAKELGVDVVFVPTTWKTLTTDLNNGEFHMGMGGITRTIARQKIVEQSSPYLIFGKSFLINSKNSNRFKSISDLDKVGNKIGVNRGGTNEVFAKNNIRQAEIVYFEKNLDVPIAVANGEVDAMVSENIEVLAYEKKDRRFTGLYTSVPLTKNNFGYLIRKNDIEMLNMINFILHELELRGEISALQKKYNLK